MRLSTKTETLKDLTIDYEYSIKRSGGQTIILIHGIGVSNDYFTPFTKKLAEYYTVYALDLPGYGKTPKPSHPLNITELSEVVYNFIKLHHLKNVIPVGHSMGAQIVTELYKNHPESVSKLILLAPTTNKDERHLLLQGFRLMQDTFIEPVKTNFVIFSNYLRMGMLRYLKTAKYMLEYRTDIALKNITIPTLIVGGEKDPVVPKKWVNYLASLSPHISQAKLAKSPHAFQFSRPERLASLCRTFIEK